MRVAFCTLAFVLLSLSLLPQLSTIQAQVGDYNCLAFSCYNTATLKYQYTRATCRVTAGSLPGQYNAVAVACSGSEDYCHPESSTHLNTNYSPFNSACVPGGVPVNTGCQQGLYGSNIPSCSGQEGGGGGDCPYGCVASDDACTDIADEPSCPGAYQGRTCDDIPCGFRSECGCYMCLHNCSDSCSSGACGGGGGGPTATPTPTPTPMPSCTLTCPGTPLSGLSGGTVSDNNATLGNFGGATVRGATTLLAQGTGTGGTGTGDIDFHACGPISGATGKDPATMTFGMGYIEDNLVFNGQHSFDCRGLYSCPLDPDNPEVCPVPTITYDTGGGGSATLGVTTARTNPDKRTSTIGKVLGAISDKLLAAKPGGGVDTGTGSGQYSSTWTKAVTINRLIGSEPTLYGYTATNDSGQSCSCQAILGCFESQQASPNSDEMASGDCDEACNLTFDSGSELPENTEAAQMTIQANSGFEANVDIDYDDGTTETLAEPYPSSKSHLFSNSGVYNVKLTCRNNGNNEKTCTRRLSVYCEGSEPETLPTATPTPPDSWMKFQNASLYTKTSMANPAPTGAVAFDETDVLSCGASDPLSRACVISGKAGVAITKGTASYGERLSAPEWLRTDSNYTMNTTLDPDSFIEYARARKEVNDVASLDTSEVELNAINVYQGNATINNNDLPDFVPVGGKMLVVIDGNLTINMPQQDDRIFNPDQKPFAFIVTGEIEIASATEELNGIFISNTVDYAYDSLPFAETPLKINGNFVTMSSSPTCATKRQRQDNKLQSSCFTNIDIRNQYVPLWDLLSTRTYEWTELVP